MLYYYILQGVNNISFLVFILQKSIKSSFIKYLYKTYLRK